jgi:hypothetical protein
MAHGPPAPERLDAHVAGQHISFSTYNIVNVLFIALLGALVYLFWDAGKVIMERDMQDRHRIAQEQLQVLEAIRTRLEQQHAVEMERQLEVARAVLRVLLAMDYNIRHVGEPEELPFGTLPPWLTPPPPPVPK